MSWLPHDCPRYHFVFMFVAMSGKSKSSFYLFSDFTRSTVQFSVEHMLPVNIKCDMKHSCVTCV